MIFRLLERISKISVYYKNSDFYSSSLYYRSWVQTNRFYAKAVQFSPRLQEGET